MSYVMTYDSLLSSLQRWTWRQNDLDLLAEFPRLVDSTERKVARAIKVLLARQNASGSFIIGQGLVQKPTRLLEAISWRYLDTDPDSDTYNQSIELKKRTYEYIRGVYPNVLSAGPPKYYADFDYNNHFIGPDCDLAYPYEMTYYERPEPIDETVSSNFLTEFVPDLMLYGLLLEASPFLVDADTDMWQSLYDRKLQELGLEDDDQKIPESQKLKGSRK